MPLDALGCTRVTMKWSLSILTDLEITKGNLTTHFVMGIVFCNYRT